MLVLLQICGALLIVAPFAAQQFGRVSPDAPAYLWLNLIGSALLAALAVAGRQWGFVLLEKRCGRTWPRGVSFAGR